MAGDNLLYDIYERRLAARIDPATVPHHVGVILDGNRRWAKSMGFGAAQGHKRGADKIEEFLGWAEQMGVQVVTLWLLSTDNLARDPAELSPLLDIIAHAVDELAETGRWSLRLVGAVDLLPEPLAERLRTAVVRSRPSSAEASGSDGPADEAVETAEAEDRRMQVNIAVGYGGRQEIADAVRELLRERAAAGASLEEVAASLGYRVNVSASSLARKRSSIIGLVLPNLRNAFFEQIAACLGRAAARRGLTLFVTVGSDQSEVLHQAVESLLGVRVAGIIFVSPWLPGEDLVAIGEEVPVCVIGRRSPGGRVDSVRVDEEAAAHLVVDHLATLGMRTMCYIGPRLTDAASRHDREHSLARAADAAGLAFEGRRGGEGAGRADRRAAGL